ASVAPVGIGLGKGHEPRHTAFAQTAWRGFPLSAPLISFQRPLLHPGPEPRTTDSPGCFGGVFPFGAALLSLRRPVFSKRESCVLFHIKCQECGSHIVKTTADANSEFDKAIAGIKLLGPTPDTEPSRSKGQVELFCLNGHELALKEIGRQMVE